MYPSSWTSIVSFSENIYIFSNSHFVIHSSLQIARLMVEVWMRCSHISFWLQLVLSGKNKKECSCWKRKCVRLWVGLSLWKPLALPVSCSLCFLVVDWNVGLSSCPTATTACYHAPNHDDHRLPSFWNNKPQTNPLFHKLPWSVINKYLYIAIILYSTTNLHRLFSSHLPFPISGTHYFPLCESNGKYPMHEWECAILVILCLTYLI